MPEERIDASKIINMEALKALDMECKKIPKTIKPAYAAQQFIPLVVEEFMKLRNLQKVVWHGNRATIFYKNGSQIYLLPKMQRSVSRNAPG
jgi:hypothetical protein